MFSRPLRRLAPLLVALVAGLSVGVLAAQPAFAHTQLDSSIPSSDELVLEPVDVIVLTFSQPIELLDNSIRLVGLPGRVTTITRSDDGTEVRGTVSLPLTDGNQEVAWRVLASDSHPREGTFSFTVIGAPAPTTTPAPSAMSTPSTTEPL